MTNLKVTLDFCGEVHEMIVECTEAEASSQHFLRQLKNRLECSPEVLAIEEAE
jgi:hypothetical protein